MCAMVRVAVLASLGVNETLPIDTRGPERNPLVLYQRYMSQVYRERVPAHIAAINILSLRWMWNFAPLRMGCVHARSRDASTVCAAHATARRDALDIVAVSPNLGLIRLEKYGFSLPPCTSRGQVLPQSSLPLQTSHGEEWVEVIRLDDSAYVRSGEFYRGVGSRTRYTALGKEGGPNGCWFVIQRGSGIFVRVRRSLRVSNRSELVKSLNLTLDGLRKSKSRRERDRRKLDHEQQKIIRLLEDHVSLCPRVRAYGYDTLIFDEIAGRSGYGTQELVSCRDECVQIHLNGSCVPGLRTGWTASLPCACNRSLPILNCALTGVTEVGPWPDTPYHYVPPLHSYHDAIRYATPRLPRKRRVVLPYCEGRSLLRGRQEAAHTAIDNGLHQQKSESRVTS